MLDDYDDFDAPQIEEKPVAPVAAAPIRKKFDFTPEQMKMIEERKAAALEKKRRLAEMANAEVK